MKTLELSDPETLTELMPTPELSAIALKVFHGNRLSPSEGLSLLTTDHDFAVEDIADSSRKRRVGDVVYFASTLHLHPTNLCELSCPMCSFYAKPGWDTAWFSSPEQIEEKVRHHLDEGITEIHITGGMWKDCNIDYYKDIFGRIKSVDTNLHIKALTPVEFDYLAQLHGITVEEVFDRLIDAGLGSLPGGGAEILVENVRNKISPQKITSDQYLDTHRIAHNRGLTTNMTMLFGHIEDHEDIITHLCRVRELQDETGGIDTFVPLKYLQENNALGKRENDLKPKAVNRIYAVSRLMLDNVRNLKVLWNYIGIDEAQHILRCGANDFGSTTVGEKISRMAGGGRDVMDAQKINNLIEEVGRTPKQIHSGHDYSQDDAP